MCDFAADSSRAYAAIEVCTVFGLNYMMGFMFLK